MGSTIIYKVFKKFQKRRDEVHIVPLAAAGGFFDAIGGGATARAEKTYGLCEKLIVEIEKTHSSP